MIHGSLNGGAIIHKMFLLRILCEINGNEDQSDYQREQCCNTHFS